MRFMVLMISAVYQPQNRKKLEAGFTPDPEMMDKMGKFSDDLKAKGALISLDGLQPPSAGARLSFSKGQVKFTDGPAIKAKEVLGGYWILKAKSKRDVIEWMKRCPAQDGDIIEIRPIFEGDELPRKSKVAARSRKS